jgi:hypothetical protein
MMWLPVTSPFRSWEIRFFSNFFIEVDSVGLEKDIEESSTSW